MGLHVSGNMAIAINRQSREERGKGVCIMHRQVICMLANMLLIKSASRGFREINFVPQEEQQYFPNSLSESVRLFPLIDIHKQI